MIWGGFRGASRSAGPEEAPGEHRAARRSRPAPAFPGQAGRGQAWRRGGGEASCARSRGAGGPARCWRGRGPGVGRARGAAGGEAGGGAALRPRPTPARRGAVAGVTGGRAGCGEAAAAGAGGAAQRAGRTGGGGGAAWSPWQRCSYFQDPGLARGAVPGGEGIAGHRQSAAAGDATMRPLVARGRRQEARLGAGARAHPAPRACSRASLGGEPAAPGAPQHVLASPPPSADKAAAPGRVSLAPPPLDGPFDFFALSSSSLTRCTPQLPPRVPSLLCSPPQVSPSLQSFALKRAAFDLVPAPLSSPLVASYICYKGDCSPLSARIFQLRVTFSIVRSPF